MEYAKDKGMEATVRKAVRRAFRQLLRTIENEPGLILEGADQSEENKTALVEVRSWLFRRREENGSRDVNPDN